MNIRVTRIYKGDYTIGNLYVDGVWMANTLEDKDRGLNFNMSLSEIQRIKVYGETAIPIGIYKIDMDTISPKFKDRAWAKCCNGKIPRLKGVKGFEGVLIHVGNTPADTLGCILVGYNKIKGQIINSSDTFKRLYAIMKEAYDKQEEITIEIC